ncbi:MAG: DNA polymerase III subunit gamma/tau [Proteobacteria bacterium]|nr:DNA polymerase III subunit gamma/tau [Pseudomonadota bacterium]MBU1640991.1 DNA polymerase III subunit gamma/tau [Pseudomonadota bacterium]
MSYLVLARKWRPQTFNDVVGQQPIVRTLLNAIRRKRVAHAMLFSGVRGVGKTTLARIMAKALNCQSEDADVPCNVCKSCQEITAGNAVDLKEIDGASNRGIQEIRELKENIRFFPTSGRFKIVIIDEVHMLTNEAFNALLKTLEEPPEHVYFMFATTEIHKVPITILSRCQRYELKRVGFDTLSEFFARIATSEQVGISPTALEMIVREADGSVRDGLSLLDQMFSFAAEDASGAVQVKDEDVVQVLGLVDRQVFVTLARAAMNGDLARCLEILEETYLLGVDLKRFSDDLLGFFRGLMVCKTSREPGQLLDVAAHDLDAMMELAASASKESLYQFFQVFMQGAEELRHASQPRLALEMTFVRASQVGQVMPAAELAQRLDKLIAASGGVVPVLQGQTITQKKTENLELAFRGSVPADGANGVVTREPEQVLTPAGPPAVVPQYDELPPGPEKIEKPPADQRVDEPVSSPGSGGRKVVVELHQRHVIRDWASFIDYVKERKAWMAQTLRLCDNPKLEGDKLLFRFDNPADCTLLSQHDNLKALTTFAQDFFQTELCLEICSIACETGEGDGTSPREERRALAAEPLVQMVTEIFDGKVVGIRTGPKFR